MQTTDGQGRFAFERVVPGEGRIGRVVANLNEPHGSSSSCMIAATFPAGKTAHIDLGTTGRPVIGRLKLPGKSQADNPWSFALLLVRPSDLQLSETGPRFSGTVDRDGNFCIDDVPAGVYWLLIHFAKSRRRPVADCHLSVPAVDEKLSQRPVDLGIVTVTPGGLKRAGDN